MSKTFLQPMGDYLLVADKERTTTIDGITLPDSIKQQEMCFGFVVAVGPDCKAIQEKATVCYGPYAGKGVVIDGIEFRILREGQVEGRVIQNAEDL